MKVFIRADANREVGWGHVVRSGALADGLRARGHRVTWLLKDSDAEAEGWLRRRSRVVRLRRELTEEIPGVMKPGDWLVIDRYGWTSYEHGILKSRGFKLMAIDDTGPGAFAPDLLLNPNPGAERARYRTAPWTRRLLGAKYVLLRQEFREAGPLCRPGKGRILVSFGGGDRWGAAARVCRLLPEGVEATVVVGPSGKLFKGPRMVRGATASRMSRLMERSVAAIVPPSSICWELARVGVPAAILGTADNQALVERSLREAGAAFPLGWHSQVKDGPLRRRLATFLGDAAGRARAARGLRRLVDGKGVDRVIEAMGL